MSMRENETRLTYRGKTSDMAYSDYPTREIINRLAGFEDVGTIDEFKALKEKSVAKKVKCISLTHEGRVPLERGEWIPVSERLSEKGKAVLTCTKDG